MNLSHMYNLASDGNVRALRYAVNRGLNIDSVDKNGNTGLCHSILQRNYTAYNTFRAVGANPRHPCTQTIAKKSYDSFVSSRRVVPVDETPREVYMGYGRGEYSLTKTTWVLGGVAVAGLAAWAIFGSSGGGGSKHGGILPDGGDPKGEKSLAEFLGTKVPSSPQSGYIGPIVHAANGGATKINEKNYDNFDYDEIDNDSLVFDKNDEDGEEVRLVELINFNSYMNDYNEYVMAFMKATNGSIVQNGTASSAAGEPYVNLGNNVAGLVAYKGSTAINYGVLHIRAQNGSFGLVGSKDSVITNKGRVNISLTNATSKTGVFHDELATTENQISAMYVDTRSSAVNEGLIDGVSTINGRVIGMQGRIINQEDYPVSTVPMLLTNAASGTIQLKVTAEGGVNLSTNMVGMGSYIEQTFLDAQARLSRAAYVKLVNDGDIEMILNVVDQPYDNNNSYEAAVISGNDGVVGMRADANTTAINNGSIKVDLTYAPNVSGAHAGMVAVRGGVIENRGAIDIVAGKGGYGMFGGRGTGINAEIDLRHPYLYNYGTINIDSENGYGMASLFEGLVLNDKNAVINMNSQGTGMYINLGNAVNNGIINVGGSSIGMDSERGTLINSGTGKINASGAGSVGVRTSQGQGKNEGIINASGGAIGMQANGSGGSVTNDKDINISNSSIGMQASNGGTATNNSTLTLNGSESIAMQDAGSGSVINSATGSIVLNSGAVDAYGIKISDGAASNRGTITVSSNNSYAMFGDAGRITNETGAVINVDGSSVGMQTVNGRAYNYGDINVSAGGTAIKSTNTAAAGYNYGNINLNGTGAYGLYAQNGTLTNYGSITGAASDVVGVFVSAGKASNSSSINLTGSGATGMKATGGEIENSSSINITSGTGMSVDTSGKATNSGTISVGTGTGMKVVTNGEIINNNTITVNNGVGMQVTTSGTATNNKTINVSNGTGMAVNGGGTATNAVSGVINVTSGTGMSAVGGGTITNLGEINISSNSSTDYGMYASGASSNIVNNGIIKITGSVSPTCDPDAGCGNHIYITNGATFTNSAVLRSAFAINFGEMSDEGSKMLIGKGGSYEAPELEGVVYADSSIVTEGFDKVYVNDDSFVGENKGIDLVSNSALFDARLEKNDNGAYKVVMTMKDFVDVVDVGAESSSSVASFLQSNYDNGFGAELMSVLKASSSLRLLNSDIVAALGLDTIPNFAKQNLDVIKSLDAKMNESLFLAELEAERIVIGYDYYNRDQDGLGVFTGYEDQAHSTFVLADKKYNENFRYGVGASYTRYKSDYDNKSTRTENIIQVLAPLTVEFDEAMTLISIPRLGYGFGEYKRRANNEVYKADTKNYYYGITNELRRSFDMGMIILEPVAEFNILGLYQDSTREKNGVSVNSSNNLSIETGLGLYARKEFKLTEVDTLRLRLGGTYYYELNNPYQAATARYYGMAGTYHMESYETQRNRGVLSLRADYQREMLNFYVQLNQYLEDENAFSFNIGVGYQF